MRALFFQTYRRNFEQEKQGCRYDYRHFREPDLVLLNVDDAWSRKLEQNLPELPRSKEECLMKLRHLLEKELQIQRRN